MCDMVSQLSISIRCHQLWPDYIISIPFLRLFFGNCQKFQKTSVKCLKFDVSNVSMSPASGASPPDPKGVVCNVYVLGGPSALRVL